MREQINSAVIGTVIGAFLGPSIIILFTLLTAIIPISETIDLVLLLGFAPGAYCGLLCISTSLFAVLGFIMGYVVSLLKRVVSGKL
ncbi:MAG: hypothetical protein GTO18_04470 [Anaerolineales bacterium]|nr:hypothetical protein [Anaerolineales bacterium]